MRTWKIAKQKFVIYIERNKATENGDLQPDPLKSVFTLVLPVSFLLKKDKN